MEQEQTQVTDSKRTLKLLLIIIPVVVVVSLVLVYFGTRSEEITEEVVADITGYSQNQVFDFDVIISLDEEEQSTKKAKGRVLDIVVDEASDYDNAIIKAKLEAEVRKEDTENVWRDPVSRKPEEVTFPLKTEWLLFSEMEVDSILIRMIDNLNLDNISYSLDDIDQIEIIETDNVDELSLRAKVTISLDQLILIPEPALEPTSTPEEMVLIEETGTGWLRVREGPGTSYKEVTKVDVGDTFPLLEESYSWYKIRIEDKEGWIYSEYATKQ